MEAKTAAPGFEGSPMEVPGVRGMRAIRWWAFWWSMWFCGMYVLFGGVYKCRVKVGELVTCGWTIYGGEEYTLKLQPYLPSLPTLPSFVSSDLHQMDLAILFLSSLCRYQKSRSIFSCSLIVTDQPSCDSQHSSHSCLFGQSTVRPRVRHRPTNDEPDNPR